MTLTKWVDAQLRYPYDLHMRGSDYFLIEVLEYKAHSGGFESCLLYTSPSPRD